MKNRLIHSFKALLFLVATFFVSSLFAQPTITSFSPLKAKPGDALTITGTGFNTSTANNIVFLGATRAIVTAATGTSVSIIVPKSTTYDNISLLNVGTGLAAYSGLKFTPTFGPTKSSITSGDILLRQDIVTGSSPGSTASADLDGDGKPELVIANSTVNGQGIISVYRNKSNRLYLDSASFDSKMDYSTSAPPTPIAVAMGVSIGDIDADGKQDLILVNRGFNTVSIFRNTSSLGNISFDTKVDFTTGTLPVATALGDLNTDGKLDIVTLNRTSNTISAFRNTSTVGNISFATRQDFTTNSLPTKLAIGDLNADGKPEVVATGGTGTNRLVSVFPNTSTSSINFSTKVDFVSSATSSSLSSAVQIADFDDDTKLDLVVTGTAGDITVLRNALGTGTIAAGFFSAFVNVTSSNPAVFPLIGDFDGDSKVDLLISGTLSLSFFRNLSSSGNISFGSQVDIIGAPLTDGVVLCDFDGDNKPDIGQSVGLYRSADTTILTPTISSFSPINAKPNDTIIIAGTNFNRIANNNRVFFGATKGTVITASTNSLSVLVPKGATFAPISINNIGIGQGYTAYSKTNFIPKCSPAKSTLQAGEFLPKIDFVTGTSAATQGPQTVVVGDLDGDGKSELVVGTGSVTSVYRNISSTGAISASSFATKFDISTGSVQNLCIRDLNGDGRPELIYTNGSTIVILKNNILTTGNILPSNFAPAVTITTGSGAGRFSVCDFDGDGRLDLAVANSTAGTLSILRNVMTTAEISTSSFATKVDFAISSPIYSIDAADLDGDGKPDLAVSYSSSGRIAVLRNTATSGSITTSSFSAKLDVSPVVANASTLVLIADIDGDNKNDLVSNEGSIYRNTATSGSLTTSSFAAQVNNSLMTGLAAIGDLDGDGKLDLLTVNSSLVTVFRNSTNSGSITTSSFAERIRFGTNANSNASSAAIGDLDLDGRPDLVVTNNSSVNFSIFRNGDPKTPPPTITSFTPTSAKSGDEVTITGLGFNTTPSNNIVFLGATMARVTSSTLTSITLTVPIGATCDYISLLNTSTGLSTKSVIKFTPKYDPSKSVISIGDFSARQNFRTGKGPFSVAIGDLDGDGKADMVVVNSTSNTVSVFRNTSNSGSLGSSSFATKVDFATGTTPYSISIVDLDVDGKLDLVITNNGSSSISILRNTATSGSISATSFATKVDITTGTAPYRLAVADFDDDGKPDIFVTGSTTLSTFRNISSPGSIVVGSFESSIGTITAAIAIAIADMDIDNKPDLVLLTTTGVIQVYPNESTRGQIYLGVAKTTSSLVTPISMAVSDFDGDGKPDIAIGNATTGKVSIFRNTATIGSSSFASKVDFLANTADVNSIDFGDINGDGKLDFVSSSALSTVSIFRSTATSGTIVAGSFASAVNLTVNTTNWSAAIGDLDGDGRPDIVAANNGDSTISVMRNIGLITNANLSNLTTNIGSLNPTFESSKTTYSITTNAISLAVIPTAADTNATIKLRVNGGTYTSVSSGNISGLMTLNLGSNTIEVLVKAQDTLSTKTYIITVTRIASNNADLSALVISGGVLSPSFSSGTISYIASVSNATTSVTVTPTLADPNASIQARVNGGSYAILNSNTVSGPLSLNVGSNTIDVLITAQDGISIRTYTITVNRCAASLSTTNLSICSNALPYIWNDLTFNAAGSQTKTGFINSLGCDSSATLNLTVLSTSTSIITVSACNSYTWNGVNYTTSGVKTYTTTNSQGCDSVATLNLTVLSTSTSIITVSACNSYTWNGVNYTTSGVKTYTTTNSQGCDSVASLNLTITTPSSSSETVSACNSYTWNGVNYTTSGVKTYTTTNSQGCDSIATLNLTIKSATSSTDSITVNANQLPYLWNGLSFNAAGTQTAQLTNAAGCDSAATLTLSVAASTVAFNVKAMLQGLYLGNGKMISALRSADGISPMSIADSITIELRNHNTPYNVMFTIKGLLDTAGNATITLPGSVNGNSYYVVINHRNSISTWSANPVTFSASTNYDFTNSISKALGGNMAEDAGVFMLFSGDINQDGSVDFNDYPDLDISSNNGDLGYYVTDLNGDASVDFNDYPILDINSNLGALVVTP